MASTSATARLLHGAYTTCLGFAGASGLVLGLAYLNIPNPNETGRAIILAAALLFAVTLIGALASRLAMRLFFDRVCGSAFEAWRANPSLGPWIDAETLAELAELSADQTWNARQFLERRARAAGIGHESDLDTHPDRRRYRFPKEQTQPAPSAPRASQ